MSESAESPSTFSASFRRATTHAVRAFLIRAAIGGAAIIVIHEGIAYRSSRISPVRQVVFSGQLIQKLADLEHNGLQVHDGHFVLTKSGTPAIERTAPNKAFSDLVGYVSKLVTLEAAVALENSTSSSSTRLQQQLNELSLALSKNNEDFDKTKFGSQVAEILQSLPEQDQKESIQPWFFSRSAPAVTVAELRKMLDRLFEEQEETLQSLQRQVTAKADSVTLYVTSETLCGKDRATFFLLAIVHDILKQEGVADDYLQKFSDVHTKIVPTLTSVQDLMRSDSELESGVMNMISEHVDSMEVRAYAVRQVRASGSRIQFVAGLKETGHL